MSNTLFSAILKDAYMLSPSVKHFTFEAALSSPFTYIPGQFITIHFEYQSKSLKRSYSIANIPADDNRIEFAASYVENGPGTELLFNLQPGDAVTMSGPYGRLILRDTDPKRYILTATSTGVTPYRAMLKELTQRLLTNPSLEVIILQGVQTAEHILYRDDFIAFAQAHPRASFRAYLSRNNLHPDTPYEYNGYVQHAFSELTLNPMEDMIYLCGNPSMIDDAFNGLKEHGFTTQHIIREKYISR